MIPDAKTAPCRCYGPFRLRQSFGLDLERDEGYIETAPIRTELVMSRGLNHLRSEIILEPVIAGLCTSAGSKCVRDANSV